MSSSPPTPGADPSAARELAERERFPGDDLVAAGLADIAGGRRSVEALLVRQTFDSIEPELYRFPAIDAVELRSVVAAFVTANRD